MVAKLLLWFSLMARGLGLSCNTRYQVSNVCSQNYGTALNVFTNIPSAVACAVRCCDDTTCLSVLYDVINTTCTTNSGVATGLLPGCGLKYAEFIQGDCKIYSSNVGVPCGTSNDCSGVGSTCWEGICRCGAGYSLDPSSNTCLECKYLDITGDKACNDYGTDFTTFEAHLLSGYNDKIISGLNEQTCKAACLDETEFVCITAELSSSGSCYITHETALTVPESLHTDSSVYTMYQRNCAYV